MPVSKNSKNGKHNIIGVAVPQCDYCGKELDFEFDYSCITCGHITCDNHQEACSEEEGDYVEQGCDLVTCFVCLEAHTKAHHSDTLYPYHIRGAE